MKCGASIALAILAWCGGAGAEEVRFHASGGAAHAVGPPQQREFGGGGGAGANVEVALARAVGVQVGGGVLVLAKGDRPEDPSIAPSSTGVAVFGTAGVRAHLLGKASGPWVDANAGVAMTGNLLRPSADAHVGWALPMSREAGVFAGPFLGYTQVFQPDSELRDGDARVLWAGLSVTFGPKDDDRGRAAPSREDVRTPPPRTVDRPPPSEDVDATVASAASAGGDDSIRLVEDRILLDDVIEFEFDRAEIRSTSHELVRRVALFLAGREEIREISIEGHADAVGGDAYNLTLSQARAESTRAMLVGWGVDPARMKVVAHGKSKLKVLTALANPRNRRVEFLVTRLHGETAHAGGSALRGEQ